LALCETRPARYQKSRCHPGLQQQLAREEASCFLLCLRRSSGRKLCSRRCGQATRGLIPSLAHVPAYGIMRATYENAGSGTAAPDSRSSSRPGCHRPRCSTLRMIILPRGDYDQVNFTTSRQTNCSLRHDIFLGRCLNTNIPAEMMVMVMMIKQKSPDSCHLRGPTTVRLRLPIFLTSRRAVSRLIDHLSSRRLVLSWGLVPDLRECKHVNDRETNHETASLQSLAQTRTRF
jgi:hypothetical protein